MRSWGVPAKSGPRVPVLPRKTLSLSSLIFSGKGQGYFVHRAIEQRELRRQKLPLELCLNLELFEPARPTLTTSSRVILVWTPEATSVYKLGAFAIRSVNDSGLSSRSRILKMTCCWRKDRSKSPPSEFRARA